MYIKNTNNRKKTHFGSSDCGNKIIDLLNQQPPFDLLA
jgi:hypothetical protein